MRRIGWWVLAFGTVAQAAAAMAGTDVLLLNGFEPDQAARLGAQPEGDDLKWQVNAGRALWFRKGDASQGQYALTVDRESYLNADGKTPLYILRFQGSLSTYGRFDKWFATADWSGYQTLRLDVKLSAAAGRIRVEVEDDICQPMISRAYDVPAGRWVTLEFDLARAAEVYTLESAGSGRDGFKGRRLNLARIANLYLLPERLEGKTRILIDNIRLVAGGVAEKTDTAVLTDERPFPRPLPLPPARPTPPARARPAGDPAGRPDPPGPPRVRRLDLSRARATSYPRIGPITSRAFCHQGPDRLLIGFLAGYMHVLASDDGGATWHGLDGGPDPTACYHQANAPSHVAWADGAEMLYVHTAHCPAGGNPANMFFRHVVGRDGRWTLGPPSLVDVDCRHCPEFRVRAIRSGNGRMWAVWMHQDRRGKQWLRGRFSDDGRLWRDPGSNAMLTIDGDGSQGAQPYGVTLWPADANAAATTQPDGRSMIGMIDEFYPHGGFELTRFGDEVACIYTRTWHPRTLWTRFDGGAWLPPQPVGNGVPLSATTLDERTVFLAMLEGGKVRLLRLEGERWVEDSPGGLADTGQFPMKSVLLSRVGRRVVCFWTRVSGETVSVWMSARRAAGGWDEPVLIAEEKPGGAGPGARQNAAAAKPSLALTAPQFADGPFIPLAWGPADGWIRMTLVPVR